MAWPEAFRAPGSRVLLPLAPARACRAREPPFPYRISDSMNEKVAMGKSTFLDYSFMRPTRTSADEIRVDCGLNTS